MNKLLSMLSICRKANCMAIGYNRVEESLSGKKARLLILTSDLSERSAKRLLARAEGLNIPVRNINATADDVWRVVGRRAAAMAVTDGSLAQAVVKLIDNHEEGTHI